MAPELASAPPLQRSASSSSSLGVGVAGSFDAGAWLLGSPLEDDPVAAAAQVCLILLRTSADDGDGEFRGVAGYVESSRELVLSLLCPLLDEPPTHGASRSASAQPPPRSQNGDAALASDAAGFGGASSLRSDAGADGDGGGGSGGGSRAAQFLRVLLDYVANDGCNLLLAAADVGAQAVALPLLRRAGGNPPLLSGNLGRTHIEQRLRTTGESAMHLAVRGTHRKMTELLLRDTHLMIDGRSAHDAKGITPLEAAAALDDAWEEELAETLDAVRGRLGPSMSGRLSLSGRFRTSGGSMPATLQAGRYTVSGQVQAAVFYAQDSISHREVCLKVYDGASRRAAAKREASVLRLLGGETAPVLYDAFVEGDRTILVIEFADHQYSDLATFSRARAAASPYRGIASGLSTIATRAVALRLLQCADKLHDKGLVHNDLKPAHFLRFGGDWKLIDYDAVLEEGEARHADRYACTPQYAPPEILSVRRAAALAAAANASSGDRHEDEDEEQLVAREASLLPLRSFSRLLAAENLPAVSLPAASSVGSGRLQLQSLVKSDPSASPLDENLADAATSDDHSPLASSCGSGRDSSANGGCSAGSSACASGFSARRSVPGRASGSVSAAAGRLVVRASADVWSLGLVLYELCNGRQLLGDWSDGAGDGADGPVSTDAQDERWSADRFYEVVASRLTRTEWPDASMGKLITEHMLGRAPPTREPVKELMKKKIFRGALDTEKSKHVMLLALFSSPRRTRSGRTITQLQLMNEIQECCEAIPHMQREIRPAATFPDDVAHVARELSPRVIQFSGHGNAVRAGAYAGALAFERGGTLQPVPPDELIRLLREDCPDLQAVLLHGCHTLRPLGELIHREMPHLYVIGWDSLLEDKAAIAFCRGFYGKLGEMAEIELAGGPPASIHDAFAEAARCFEEQGFILGDPEDAAVSAKHGRRASGKFDIFMPASYQQQHVNSASSLFSAG